MVAEQYIPAGRTSVVKRKGNTLQLQTEYACRPVPRISTTILDSGQVLHKIERELDKPVSSLAEQREIEESIRKQHAEVMALVKNDASAVPISSTGESSTRKVSLSFYDQFLSISGVKRVYRLDNDGNFVGARASEQFKTLFAEVFRNIRDLLEIFLLEPGVGVTREKGVCEICRDQLYLVSAGPECYIVVIERPDPTIEYEAELKDIVDPDPFRKSKSTVGQTQTGDA
ncbi:MAG: hypothetical protein JSU65_10175 [Candidatus Zixiibacteriota bacterium]|nr:MAG: hypothetical protein JSU65_10175 [candidate division Zixibacteria bacterium]